MTPKELRKLERLAALLDEAGALIRDLVHGEGDTEAKHKPLPAVDAQALLQSLKALDRAGAKDLLDQMKHHELGAVFGEAGGPTTDKKKPKVWLIEQILWRTFDFDRGHDAIRSKGASE